MSYCTREQVKSAGGTGSVAELDDAIAAATERVENYTSEWFEPRTETMVLRVDKDGIARPRRKVASITSLAWVSVGAGVPIEPGTYRIGALDRIELYGLTSWYDDTIHGAESYVGGFANLLRGRDREVSVEGVFGYDEPPVSVQLATAMIAAQLRGADADSEVPGSRTDVEGNVLPVVPRKDAPQGDREPLRDRTTGVAAADALLASYVREPVRLRA